MAGNDEPEVFGQLHWCWLFEDVVKILADLRQVSLGNWILALDRLFQAFLRMVFQQHAVEYLSVCERLGGKNVERSLQHSQMLLRSRSCGKVGALAGFTTGTFLGLHFRVEFFEERCQFFSTTTCEGNLQARLASVVANNPNPRGRRPGCVLVASFGYNLQQGLELV